MAVTASRLASWRSWTKAALALLAGMALSAGVLLPLFLQGTMLKPFSPRRQMAGLSLAEPRSAGTVTSEEVARVLFGEDLLSSPNASGTPVPRAVVRAVLVIYGEDTDTEPRREAWVREFDSPDELERIGEGLRASRMLVFAPSGSAMSLNVGELQLALRTGLSFTVWINCMGFSLEPGCVGFHTTFASPELARALLAGVGREPLAAPREAEGILRFLASPDGS